jgi:hypothetical protein
MVLACDIRRKESLLVLGLAALASDAWPGVAADDCVGPIREGLAQLGGAQREGVEAWSRTEARVRAVQGFQDLPALERASLLDWMSLESTGPAALAFRMVRKVAVRVAFDGHQPFEGID